MLTFFKKPQQKELVTLINTIRFDTLNYFLKPLISPNEFVNLSFELISQVWFFFMKSITEACNFFNLFLELLLSSNGTMGKNAEKCLSSLIESIFYFTASILLTLLNIIRITSISVTSIIKLFFDDTAKSVIDKYLEKIIHEQSEIDKFFDVLFDEQQQRNASLDQISQDMDDFISQSNHFLLARKRLRSSSGDGSLEKEFPEFTRIHEMITSIKNANKNRPIINRHKLGNLEYLNSIRQSIAEHHLDLITACNTLGDEIRTVLKIGEEDQRQILILESGFKP